MTVETLTTEFLAQYPQSEFGRAAVLTSVGCFTDHNLDGALILLERREFPPDWWSEEELSATADFLRAMRTIPEAERLRQIEERNELIRPTIEIE